MYSGHKHSEQREEVTEIRRGTGSLQYVHTINEFLSSMY